MKISCRTISSVWTIPNAKCTFALKQIARITVRFVLMASLEKLHRAIEEMMGAIASGPESGGMATTLSEQLAQIDRMKEELSDNAPPMLRHYLEKRSYAKALEFLDGHDHATEPGCES